jgi:hypothetical protein
METTKGPCLPSLVLVGIVVSEEMTERLKKEERCRVMTQAFLDF